MATVMFRASNSECVENPGDRDGTTDDQSEGAALQTQLTRTIEGELIPRLLIAHEVYAKSKLDEAPAWEIDPDDVRRFGELIIAIDPSCAFRFIAEARESGRPLETVITQLLAPAATYLGELWKADRCSFVEVTVGLSRLRQILREIGPEFESEKNTWRHGRRALLIAAPGEQHTFGIYVVEAFFRREGWEVYGGPIDTHDQIPHLVEREWFAIAGFSLSSERFLDRLPPLIGAIRRRSCNKTIGILVGGPLFLCNPELVSQVGADGSAADARDAVVQAGVLLGRKASSR